MEGGQKQNHLIVVTGPTAVGKTEVAIALANHLSTEIISCDSRQFYQGMQIGTAVPSKEQLEQIKHHFIQNKALSSYYNAYQFEVDVLQLLSTLYKKWKSVVMVGGSGMYIDAVCNGIDDIPSPDQELRKELEKKFTEEGIDSLRHMLKKVDPVYYKKADLKNHKRILKGLEVSLQSGKPYSSFLTHQTKDRPFNIIKIGLNTDRETLHQRINSRVDVMMEAGLLDEAKEFYEPYKKYKHNALNTVGYKELFSYFSGETSLDEAIELIKRNTRRYARRQLSWFHRDPAIRWFSPTAIEEIRQEIRSQIEDSEKKAQ